MTQRVVLLAACSAFAILGAATPAAAQGQSSDAPGALEEIVVTAQKRQEVLQKAPIAATVATGDQLLRQGIDNAAQLTKVAPSAQFTILRSSINVFMRGVGQTVNAANADTAIATNINGVFVATELTGGGFYDLERVEVLPGPQGTLYGRNAAGGVVNIITRKPTTELGADVNLELGNFNLINLSGGMNLPITDKLAVRLSGKSIKRDGYYNGGAYDQDTQAVRVSLLWTPTDNDRLEAVSSYNQDGGVGPQEFNNPSFFPNDPKRLPFDAEALGFYRRYITWTNSLQYERRLSDALTFTYLGGYGRLFGSSFNELNYGPNPANPNTLRLSQKIENYSHEARLNGDSERLKWVAGLYYYGADAEAASLGLTTSTRATTQVVFTQSARGYAAFGQLTYSVAEPLRITVGGRYSYDEKTLAGFTLNRPNPGVVVRFAGSKDWDNIDWKIGVDYDLTETSLLYATVQTGFNQGGFSTAPATANSIQAATFEPTKLLAFTVGTKNRFWDNRLELNAEAFYYKYDNYQVSARNIQTSQNQVYNAQDVRNYGVDFTGRVLFTEDDAFGLKVGYLSAIMEEIVLPVPPFAGLSGLELPYSPKWSVVADYSHTFRLPNGADLEAAVSYRWIDDQWGLYTHAAGTFIPSNDNIDASLSYRPESGRWSATLWGRNLEDTFTLRKTGTGAVPGPGFGAPLPPRTYGVTLTAKL